MQIAIIGGGIIGLSIAWQLQAKGADVQLFEKSRLEDSTSYVAAGMLAPHAEFHPREAELMELGMESFRLYPEFLQELQQDAGHAPRLGQCGTLWVGMDADEVRFLHRIEAQRENAGWATERVSPKKAFEMVPGLNETLTHALWMPDDAQINNRTLIKDLVMAFHARGGEIHERTTITNVEKKKGKWKVLAQENAYWVDDVVWAAGGETPLDNRPRKVKGQIIQLRAKAGILPSVMIRSPKVYLVPKGSNTLLVGATMEEVRSTYNTAGGVKDLLKEAERVFPAVREMNYHQAEVGFRPSSMDNLPIIGRERPSGPYFATGHYRHGILLTPLTAMNVTKELLSQIRPKVFSGLGPRNANQLA